MLLNKMFWTSLILSLKPPVSIFSLIETLEDPKDYALWNSITKKLWKKLLPTIELNIWVDIWTSNKPKPENKDNNSIMDLKTLLEILIWQVSLKQSLLEIWVSRLLKLLWKKFSAKLVDSPDAELLKIKMETAEDSDMSISILLIMLKKLYLLLAKV